MVKRWHLFATTGLIIFAAISWWGLSLSDPLSISKLTVSENGADHFMENFTSKTMDDKGNLHYQLQGEYLEHFPHDAHAEIINPIYTLFKQPNTQWNISSPSGRTYDNSKEVFFPGEVTIVRIQQPSDELTLHTRALLIQADTQFAQTDEAITIEHKNSTLSAVGMHADFESGVVYLISKVKGIYARK